MAQFFQAVKESSILTDEQYKKVQAEQAEVRNSTFYSALKRTKVLSDEQLVDFSCSFFGMERIGNAFKAQLDYTATVQVEGSVEQAIADQMFVLMVDGRRAFVINDPDVIGIGETRTLEVRSPNRPFRQLIPVTWYCATCSWLKRPGSYCRPSADAELMI